MPPAQTMSGLRGYRVNSGRVATPAGEAQLHRVALLEFDSMAGMQAAWTVSQGVATAADVSQLHAGRR